MMMAPYFGGTGITFEKLCEVCPRHSVDGTNYRIQSWLEDVSAMDHLIPGKSLVWIPYSSAQRFGVLKQVVWDKYQFKHYIDTTGKLHGYPIECLDWWFYEPHMEVECTIDGVENCYYVYEYNFYKKCKRKTQWAHIDRVKNRGKQKFISRKEMGILKQKERIENSINKRKK